LRLTAGPAAAVNRDEARALVRCLPARGVENVQVQLAIRDLLVNDLARRAQRCGELGHVVIRLFRFRSLRKTCRSESGNEEKREEFFHGCHGLSRINCNASRITKPSVPVLLMVIVVSASRVSSTVPMLRNACPAGRRSV